LRRHELRGFSPGFIKAINVKDGKAVRTRKFEEPIWAGTLDTAGDLMFGSTTASRDFMALNAKTGDTLWNFRTNFGIIAAPITDELDGVQYVAIISVRTHSVGSAGIASAH
jgi:alcohol dehydrogenase (cytochrome c)